MNPPSATVLRAQLEEFQRKHRTGLVTLLFTDIVESTTLKHRLGDRPGAALFDQHHQIVRDTLARFSGALEIETAGDSFLLVFATPSDAVQFALSLQARMRELSRKSELTVQDRIGIHVGEVVIKENQASAKPTDLYGIQIDTCARVMGLAGAGQILLTRSVFDSARQVLKGEDIPGVGPLEWLNHGAYLLKGLEEALEICEVREVGQETSVPPSSSEKAQRRVNAEDEPVLGWRPAIGQRVPNTQWTLEKKLGEGGFGEVWLGRHQVMKERRVFKFCFKAERVRFLKREMTLFRLLKERVGDHPNIVSLREVYFNEPPFYVEMDYVEGSDLRTWSEERGRDGMLPSQTFETSPRDSTETGRGWGDRIPLETRLEIVAQAAEGLQAAHDAGVIHRDIKPTNILVRSQESGDRGQTSEVRCQNRGVSQPSALNSQLTAKLTDFGIGQVVSQEALAGITRAGFTQTMMSDSSSSQTGSQLYMAPELLAGKPASIRSDIYSMGVVLYQLLVGDFTRPVTMDWARDIPDPLLRDDLQHCFAGNPNDRFAGAGQLAKNLRALPERQRALAEQQAAQTAREQAAYRRGLIRATSIAALIVIALTILATIAVRQTRRAREGELTARQNLYAAHMNLAQQALESNNRGHAFELLERYRPERGQNDLRGWEWRYLWRLCQSDEVLTLYKARDDLKHVSFSPDGNVLASAGTDDRVRFWDVQKRREFSLLPQEGASGSLVLFSPDGKFLATGGGSADELKVWDLETKQARLRFPAPIFSVAFSPNSGLLAQERGLQIAVWNLATGSQTATLTNQTRAVLGLAFSPDGRLLASAGQDKTIKLWDVVTWRLINDLTNHTDWVNQVTFSPDSRTLASGSWDKSVKLWDVATGREKTNHSAHTKWVSSVLFSPDGKTLITGSADQNIKLWDIVKWQEITTLKGHLDEVWALALSPDGKVLASGSKDGELKIWSTTPKREEVRRVSLPSDSVFTGFSPNCKIAVAPDHQSFCTVKHDGTVELWSATDLKKKSSFVLPGFSAFGLRPDASSASVALSPGGKLMGVWDRNGAIKLWDCFTHQQIGVMQENGVTNLAGLASGRPNMLFSPDGQTLVTSGIPEQGTTLWDVAKQQKIAVLRGATNGAWTTAFSPDGRKLAVSEGARVRAWDLGVRREIAVIPWAEGAGLAFSSDGQTLVIGSYGYGVTVWNFTTGRQESAFHRRAVYVHSLAFSPDGRRLASGRGDGSVKIWDTTTRQEVATLNKGHSHFVNACFFPDDNTLVTASMNEVLLWRAAAFSEIDAEARASGIKK